MNEEQKKIIIEALKDMLRLVRTGEMLEFSCAYMLLEGVFRGAARYGEGQGFMCFYGQDLDSRSTTDDEEKLQALFKACMHHGEQSEPAHEIGDLQDILRSCWVRMGQVQRDEVFCEFKNLQEVWRQL